MARLRPELLILVYLLTRSLCFKDYWSETFDEGRVRVHTTYTNMHVQVTVHLHGVVCAF
jgi:hypothetical protein